MVVDEYHAFVVHIRQLKHKQSTTTYQQSDDPDDTGYTLPNEIMFLNTIAMFEHTLPRFIHSNSNDTTVDHEHQSSLNDQLKTNNYAVEKLILTH